MTEATLTSDLREVLLAGLPGSVFFKHHDGSTSGVPDFTLTWRRITSWGEVKFYDDRDFDCPELQNITCRKLATAGLCYYLIYERRKGVDRTLIVAPKDMERWREAKDVTMGFNHHWVMRRIAYLHYNLLTSPDSSSIILPTARRP